MRRLIPLLTLSLSACSLTPPLLKPDAPVPAVFPMAAAAPASIPAADIGWRTMFPDARLQRLIAMALENNRDLRLAALNVEAVQAQYRIQRAARLPGIDASGQATRQRAAANGQDATSQSTVVTEQIGVGLGLSAFEIDLFGRIRSLSEAAFARYLATEEGRRAAQIALVGAVADAYLAERLALEQRDLAERTLADWQQSLDLARLLRQVLQDILNQVEAVDLVLHAHIERRGDGAFLLVAMDRQVAVGTLVGQLMDQGRVTMECEDDRLILGEQSIVISVRQAMRMLGVGLELHQVDHVDDADVQFGHLRRAGWSRRRASRVSACRRSRP